MIPHDIPEQPWIKVATDLFTLNNRDYIIAIDYHLKFVKVTHLKDTTSRLVSDQGIKKNICYSWHTEMFI